MNRDVAYRHNNLLCWGDAHQSPDDCVSSGLLCKSHLSKHYLCPKRDENIYLWVSGIWTIAHVKAPGISRVELISHLTYRIMDMLESYWLLILCFFSRNSFCSALWSVCGVPDFNVRRGGHLRRILHRFGPSRLHIWISLRSFFLTHLRWRFRPPFPSHICNYGMTALSTAWVELINMNWNNKCKQCCCKLRLCASFESAVTKYRK